MDDLDLIQYKIRRLKEALAREEAQPPEERYGIHVSYWAKNLHLNLHEGAIRALIAYYEGVLADGSAAS